jgi:DNA-binding transcriptional ArsR family regulator
MSIKHMGKVQPGYSPLFTVEIDVCPIYEFLISLDIVYDTYHGDETYEAGKAWFAALRSKVSADLRAAMRELDALDFGAFGGHKVWSNLTGLAYSCPAPRDIPTFIEQVEALTPLELLLILSGYYLRGARRLVLPDLILQAAQGNSEAQKRLCAASPAWQEIVRVLFVADATELKSRLVSLLTRWYVDVFRNLESQVVPLLMRDAQMKRELVHTMSSEHLIETATNGLEFIPEPGNRKVLLIPSFTLRPWIITTEYLDVKIFYYPIADEIVQQGHLPPANLVRMYRALADERRLRILRLLVQRDHVSLQEVADVVEVTKSTAHHHLATLRTAGLVRVSDADKGYSLRKEMLPNVWKLLQGYLQLEIDPIA